MMKIIMSGLLVCLIGVVSHTNVYSQTLRTANGYFCGYGEGDAGYIFIRQGNSIRTFLHYSDETQPKYYGVKNSNPYEIKNGSYLTIKYVIKKKYGSNEKLLRSVRFTGKINRKIKPCETD